MRFKDFRLFTWIKDNYVVYKIRYNIDLFSQLVVPYIVSWQFVSDWFPGGSLSYYYWLSIKILNRCFINVFRKHYDGEWVNVRLISIFVFESDDHTKQSFLIFSRNWSHVTYLTWFRKTNRVSFTNRDDHSPRDIIIIFI